MGGRKFKLGRLRKNPERRVKRKAVFNATKEQKRLDTTLIVSLPLTFYRDGPIQTTEALLVHLSNLVLPPWTVAPLLPLALYKIKIFQSNHEQKVTVVTHISISSDLKWAIYICGQQLSCINVPVLAAVPAHLTSTSEVIRIMAKIDTLQLCTGNHETKFVELWHHRSLTLQRSCGKD